MSFTRRLITGLAWTFAGSWTEQAINLAIYILLARLLGAEAFGLAMMGIVIVIFAEFLVRETVTESLIQLEHVEDGHRDAVFWLLGGFSIFLVLAIIFSRDAIAGLYGEPQIADFLVWLSPVVLFIGFSGVPVAGLRRDLKFKSLAIRATLGVVAGGLVGITLALKGYGAWSLIGQRIAHVFVNNIFVWFANPFMPGWRATQIHVKEVLQFGAKMIGLRATELVSLQSPTIIIGAVLGPAVVGFYSISVQIVESLSVLITNPLRAVAQPAFAHLKRGAENVGKLLRDLTQLSTFVAFATFFGLAMVAEPAVIVLFGEPWQSAAPILQTLCFLGVYFSIERLQQAVCLALGRAGPLFALSSIEAVIGIVAILIASEYGVVAVAMAHVLRYYALWPIRFAIVKSASQIALPSYLRLFVVPLLASATMAAGILLWQSILGSDVGAVLMLISSVAIGVVIYLGLASLALKERLRQGLAVLTDLRSGDRPVSPANEV